MVHRAVGILMALHQLDEAGAREALRDLASTERRKLYEIAQQVVAAQTLLNLTEIRKA